MMFKVGDRVRKTKSGNFVKAGELGTVSSVSLPYVYVAWDSGDDWEYTEPEMNFELDAPINEWDGELELL